MKDPPILRKNSAKSTQRRPVDSSGRPILPRVEFSCRLLLDGQTKRVLNILTRLTSYLLSNARFLMRHTSSPYGIVGARWQSTREGEPVLYAATVTKGSNISLPSTNVRSRLCVSVVWLFICSRPVIYRRFHVWNCVSYTFLHRQAFLAFPATKWLLISVKKQSVDSWWVVNLTAVFFTANFICYISFRFLTIIFQWVPGLHWSEDSRIERDLYLEKYSEMPTQLAPILWL